MFHFTALLIACMLVLWLHIVYALFLVVTFIIFYDVLTFLLSKMHQHSEIVDIGIPTDFTLCIICQNPDSIPLVASPRLESFNKVITYVEQHSHLEHGNFRAIHRRLQKYSVSELQKNGASWHLGCYRETVNPVKLARAEKAFQK